MTTQLKPPVSRFLNLYREDTQAALDFALRPFSRANNGDFVGFLTTLRCHKPGQTPTVSSGGSIIIKHPDAGEGVDNIDFLDYNGIKDKGSTDFFHLARLCLGVQHDYLLSSLTMGPLEELNHLGDEGSEFSLILTPKVAILCHEDPSGATDWVVDEGYACQDNVSKLVHMMLPESNSAHEDMLLVPDIKNALILMNAFCDTYDQNQELVDFVLPDLS